MVHTSIGFPHAFPSCSMDVTAVAQGDRPRLRLPHEVGGPFMIEHARQVRRDRVRPRGRRVRPTCVFPEKMERAKSGSSWAYATMWRRELLLREVVPRTRMKANSKNPKTGAARERRWTSPRSEVHHQPLVRHPVKDRTAGRPGISPCVGRCRPDRRAGSACGRRPPPPPRCRVASGSRRAPPRAARRWESDPAASEAVRTPRSHFGCVPRFLPAETVAPPAMLGLRSGPHRIAEDPLDSTGR